MSLARLSFHSFSIFLSTLARSLSTTLFLSILSLHSFSIFLSTLARSLSTTLSDRLRLSGLLGSRLHVASFACSELLLLVRVLIAENMLELAQAQLHKAVQLYVLSDAPFCLRWPPAERLALIDSVTGPCTQMHHAAIDRCFYRTLSGIKHIHDTIFGGSI